MGPLQTQIFEMFMNTRTIKEIVTEMHESGNIHLTSYIVNHAICYYPRFIIELGLVTDTDNYKVEFETSLFVLNTIVTPALQVIDQINTNQQPDWERWKNLVQKVGFDKSTLCLLKNTWVKIFREYNLSFDDFFSLRKREDQDRVKFQANEFVMNMFEAMEMMATEKRI